MMERTDRAADDLRALLAKLDTCRDATTRAVAFQVASQVAHLVGTPLNVIAGRAALIGSEPATSDRALGNVRRIEEQVQRVTLRLQQLIHFLEPPGQSSTARPAQAIVAEALALYRPIAEHRGVVLSAFAGPEPANKVEGCKTLVMLSSLLSLAIHTTTAEHPVSLQASEEAGMVIFAVAAPGMPPIDLKFEQWDALAEQPAELRDHLQVLGICSALAQRSGGQLQIAPDGSPGLTFRLHCPTIP